MNTFTLSVTSKTIDFTPIRYINVQGENNANKVIIPLPAAYGDIDLTALDWQIKGRYENGEEARAVLTKSNGVLEWVIGSDFTAHPGTLTLTLIGTDADENPIIKFRGDTQYIFIASDPTGTNLTVDTVGSLLTQATAALGLAQTAAVDAVEAKDTILARDTAAEVYEAYDPTKAYVPMNNVTYEGSSYRNTVACTGVLPTVTDNWLLIAQKGIDGTSAYQAAVLGGYAGTEEEYNTQNAAIPTHINSGTAHEDIRTELADIARQQLYCDAKLKAVKSPLYTEEYVSFSWTRKMVTGIDVNGYFVVSGVNGSDTLTILAGGTVNVADITNVFWGAALQYDDLSCVPCCVTSQDAVNGTFAVYPPLTADISNGKIGSLKSDGMHLTVLGYNALMQHVYGQNPKYCEKNKYLERYYPRLDTLQIDPPNNPFVKIGNTAIKNTGTSMAYNSSHFLAHVHSNDLRLTFQDALTPSGAFCEYDLSDNYQDGYFETFIGTQPDSTFPETVRFLKDDGYEIYVEWYLDDVLSEQVVKASNQCERFCFNFGKDNDSAKIKIYYNKTRKNIETILIGDSTFWINEIEYDLQLIPRFATVAQLFDSWGENPYIDSVPTYASAVEMQRIINADAGVTVPYENHSKGGQTSAWGKAWFYKHVKDYNPSHMITNFGVNDSNSIPSSLPATVAGPDGTLYNNRLTFAQYRQNLNDIFNMAIINGIQPIFIGGSFGAVENWGTPFFDGAQKI